MDKRFNMGSIQLKNLENKHISINQHFFNNDFIIENLSLKKNVALDIGCGYGTLSVELSKHYKEVIGVDVSDKMLESARLKSKDLNITYLTLNDEELVFNKLFDLIVCRISFNYSKDVVNALIRMKNLLNEEGKIIIIDNISKFNVTSTFTYVLRSYSDFIPNLYQYGLTKALKILKNGTSKKWKEQSDKIKHLKKQKYDEVYYHYLPDCTITKKYSSMIVIWENIY